MSSSKMEQASFRESIEFYGQAFGSSSSSASAQSASPSGENLGGWRNAIHYRINSTMQKLIGFGTVGSAQATHIKHLFLTFALAVVRTVLGTIDSGAAVHVSQADPENPQPVAPAPAGAPSGTPVSVPVDSDVSFRSTSSTDTGRLDTPPVIRKILGKPMTQLARATEVADCMYSRCLRTFLCEIVRTVSQL
eukprot:COSAG01_NODE_565_length_15436_cov_64.116581_13_plen_192_part_00